MIFSIDIVIKLIGLGFYEFFNDRMNIFDFVIVIFSWVELILFGTGSSAITAFKSVRIFKTFRVLRVTRLIRTL